MDQIGQKAGLILTVRNTTVGGRILAKMIWRKIAWYIVNNDLSTSILPVPYIGAVLRI